MRLFGSHFYLAVAKKARGLGQLGLGSEKARAGAGSCPCSYKQAATIFSFLPAAGVQALACTQLQS